MTQKAGKLNKNHHIPVQNRRKDGFLWSNWSIKFPPYSGIIHFFALIPGKILTPLAHLRTGKPWNNVFTGIRSYGLGDTKFPLYYFSKVPPTRKKCSPDAKMRHSKGITISSGSKYDICMRFEREQIRGIWRHHRGESSKGLIKCTKSDNNPLFSQIEKKWGPNRIFSCPGTRVG